VNMDDVPWVPGVRKDSDKVTEDDSRSNKGKAKQGGNSKDKKTKSARSEQVHGQVEDVPMKEDLHSEGD
jgi:hypothetical protein